MSCSSNESTTSQAILELNNLLKELVIRFDTSPSEYLKDDYGHLISILFKIRDILENTDISTCQQLVEGATAGNITTLDSTGQVIDSGCSLETIQAQCDSAEATAEQALTTADNLEARIAALEDALNCTNF